MTIWANPGFLTWRSGQPQATHSPVAILETKALPQTQSPWTPNHPASLPSLKLMEAANRLLGEANAMNSNEVFTLMDSFPKADPE